jgi:hypothetical protein
MQLKYLLFILLSWSVQLQTISAAIQPPIMVRLQDTSITADCLRIQLKNNNLVLARINRQTQSKLTFTPCYPEGLQPQTVDLDDVIQIIDDQGKVVFDIAVEGDTRSRNVAKVGSVFSLLGGIASTIGIQRFFIPTYPLSFFLLTLMFGIPLIAILTGSNALYRYYRGRNFSKRYHWLAWIGTLFSLITLLISGWLWVTYA